MSEENTQIGVYPTWGKNSKNFPKRKFRHIFMLMILFLGLTYLIAYASLADNFDSYSVADLNGQGSWTGDVSYDVQTGTVQAGANAVSQASGADLTIKKTFTTETDGIQSAYIRETNVIRDATLQIKSGATLIGQIGFIASKIQIGGTTNTSLVASPNANQWYQIEIDFRCSTDQIRGRVDGGTWSSLQASANACTNADTVQMQSDQSGTTFYFDTLTDSNAVAGAGLEADEDYIIPYLLME